MTIDLDVLQAAAMRPDQVVESVLRRPELYGLCRVAERDAALARIARVEALHRRYGLYELEDSCTDTTDEHREEHHHECADEVGEFYCDQMPVGAVCSECRTEDGERIEWPCDTKRALTEGEPSERTNRPREVFENVHGRSE